MEYTKTESWELPDFPFADEGTEYKNVEDGSYEVNFESLRECLIKFKQSLPTGYTPMIHCATDGAVFIEVMSYAD